MPTVATTSQRAMRSTARKPLSADLAAVPPRRRFTTTAPHS
jgi:hypothetical protein